LDHNFKIKIHKFNNSYEILKKIACVWPCMKLIFLAEGTNNRKEHAFNESGCREVTSPSWVARRVHSGSSRNPSLPFLPYSILVKFYECRFHFSYYSSRSLPLPLIFIVNGCRILLSPSFPIVNAWTSKIDDKRIFQTLWSAHDVRKKSRYLYMVFKFQWASC
jgi:hypothetical protein